MKTKAKTKFLFYFLKIILIICLANSAYANNPKFYIPKAPNINAVSYMAIDHHSGKVIAENNSKEKRD